MSLGAPDVKRHWLPQGGPAPIEILAGGDPFFFPAAGITYPRSGGWHGRAAASKVETRTGVHEHYKPLSSRPQAAEPQIFTLRFSLLCHGAISPICAGNGIQAAGGA